MAMAKKGKIKNQHFVPRCLLRRFSQNDKTTSVYVLGSAKFVPVSSIKTQCAADYYYGSDQQVENELSRLEGAFSKALGDLSEETIEKMNDTDLAVIRAFMHVQANRTPFAANQQRQLYESMGQQLWDGIARKNDRTFGDSSFASTFANEQMPVPGAHTVELAVRYQASISDLEVKFVRGDGFMISDHPSLTLNPWRDAHPRFRHWPTSGGLAAKGFMYIMPVASHWLAIAYDAGTYDVGEKESRLAYGTTTDQFVLNTLQSINASRLLFDTAVLSPVDLIGALDIRNRIRASEGEGPLPLRPPDLELSFLTVADANPYDDWGLAMLPPRKRIDPDLNPD